MEKDKVFRSKIGFVIFIPLIVILLLIITTWYIEGRVILGLFSVYAVVSAFILSFFNTQYTITSNGVLKIKCSFFLRKSIDIKTIKKIQPTNSVLSAPALSMDRLELFYNKFDSVIISPNVKKEFARALKNINPAIDTDNVYKPTSP